jgi:hypothetical protein
MTAPKRTRKAPAKPKAEKADPPMPVQPQTEDPPTGYALGVSTGQKYMGGDDNAVQEAGDWDVDPQRGYDDTLRNAVQSGQIRVSPPVAPGPVPTPPVPSPPPAPPTAVTVSAFSGDWVATNPTVVIGADGADAGPYADAATTGGSVQYGGLNNQPLSAVKKLVYQASYTSTPPVNGPEPYLRIWLGDGSHDLIFSPGSQPVPDVGPGPVHVWDATAGTWRYDDDDASKGVPYGAGAAFSQVLADHGADLIVRITVTTGWTPCTGLSSTLVQWDINDESFVFKA